MLETDAHHRALLLTAVPGRPVGALVLTPGRRRALHRRAGAWPRRFHGDARDLTARDRAEAAEEIERAVLDTETRLERAGDPARLRGERRLRAQNTVRARSSTVPPP
ncbi:hypothetical protein [Streptomyces sp. NPDC003480]